MIPKVKEVGTWSIGDGETLAVKICQMYGVSAPRSCQRRSLREVAETGSLIWSLIGVLPPSERGIFRDMRFSDKPDKFIFKLSADGIFSVKEFSKHLSTIVPNQPAVQPWGECIWRNWIPPKISSFLWKLFHRVVPTDDTIRRIQIPITSKCRCCPSPDIESADHLFFTSEWAITLWDKLGAIFDRPRPRGIGSLNHFWLKGNKKCFMDCLASGMASCLIWEIWKARNEVIHKARIRPIWPSCLAWAQRLGSSIKAPYSPSNQANLTIRACHIQPPVSALRNANQLLRPLESSRGQDDSAIRQIRYRIVPLFEDGIA